MPLFELRETEKLVKVSRVNAIDEEDAIDRYTTGRAELVDVYAGDADLDVLEVSDAKLAISACA